MKKRYITILSIAIIIVFGLLIYLRLYPKNTPETDKSKSTISSSVCDEVVSLTELPPVKTYQGKPASVDFSTNPGAKMFYTTITQQATESANFAGHYTIAGWGCGTGCGGYAIVDSITGKIVEYVPVNEDSNSFSYDIDSRLLILNPKKEYEVYKGKTLEEILNEDTWDAHLPRTYYEIVEEEDGSVWLNKLCTENALDGIYALGGNNKIDSTAMMGLSVTYYAKLKTISTAREARFYWYDTELKNIKSPDDKYAWFWAMPQKFFDDTKISDQWFKFMDDNNDAVFKITGIRLKDDCNYYDSDHCIEDIDVKTIEVVGTNKLMKF